MNVLVVAHYQNDGSPCASFIHAQVKAFCENGLDVRVLVPIPVGKVGINRTRFTPIIEKKVIEGVHYVFIRYFSASNFGVYWLNHFNAIISMKIYFKQIFKDFIPAIVHAHTIGLDSNIGAWISSKVDCPLVVTTHGSDTFIPLKKNKISWIKKSVVQADCIVCVSMKLKKTIECLTDIPCIVIHNGFNQLIKTEEKSFRNNRLLINQTGSLIKQKNVDITIKAFVEVLKAIPTAKLLIVGDGPQREDLVNLCSKLSVEKSVIFFGQVDNKKAISLMNNSRYFVMLSEGEGFGIVYLEAMSTGCIVFGTRGEGIEDIITDGVNGFLVEKGDFLSIANRILWCENNLEMTEKIAKRAKELALQFSWERNTKCYVELFNKLIIKQKNF